MDGLKPSERDRDGGPQMSPHSQVEASGKIDLTGGAGGHYSERLSAALISRGASVPLFCGRPFGRIHPACGA
jgi:hypothetical protein